VVLEEGQAAEEGERLQCLGHPLSALPESFVPTETCLEGMERQLLLRLEHREEILVTQELALLEEQGQVTEAEEVEAVSCFIVTVQ